MTLLIQKSRRYTARQDRIIRAGWPNIDDIAAQLDRTRLSVRNRGVLHLGLKCPSGRRYVNYSKQQRQVILDRYAKEGAIPLAREMGKPVACIVSLAGRLGARFDGLWPWTTQDDALLSDMRKRGHTQAAMAEKLKRTVPAVNKRLAHLGLTVVQGNPESRRRMLIAPHLCKGNRSIPAERRWAKDRIALGEHGWPPDLNRKEVAILESLRTRGPQTRQILSSSVGEPATRHFKKRLRTHGGRSAMARLLARGLVARCFLRDGRRATVIYALTAAALNRHGTHQSVRDFNVEMIERLADRGRRARRARQMVYRNRRAA